MLTSYAVADGHLVVQQDPADTAAIGRAAWIDLLNPTVSEEALVQGALNIEVPTREEMQEIESSSRLYREGEALYLTASFLHGVDMAQTGSTPITFVLTNTTLVTVRYATPKAFGTFAARASRQPALLASADGVLLGIFEQVVDRLADILERMAAELDRAAQTSFAARTKVRADQRNSDLRQVLITLGQGGELVARTSETLLGLSRILTFIGAEKAAAIRKENASRIKVLSRDVRSLVDHANFLNNRATFLLDATLGLISIDQSGIIKTFTVASVALMPPTLIASIYGMNFELMPELKWMLGYPFALLLMVISALLPIWYFKRKGWL
jgi:magnesium transporter